MLRPSILGPEKAAVAGEANESQEFVKIAQGPRQGLPRGSPQRPGLRHQ